MFDATTPVEVDLDPDDGIIRISRRGTCLPLTLTEAHQVNCRLTGILLQQPSTAGPVVDLAVVEQVLYRERGVIDPADVPALLAIITTAHTTTTTPPAEPAPPPGWWS
jgi:hypothetical protein